MVNMASSPSNTCVRSYVFNSEKVTHDYLFPVIRCRQSARRRGPCKDDERITTQMLTYPSSGGSGSVKGYLAKPANASGKLPAILVIHENRGLNPHIEDITRRLALRNYIAFAPDALTTLGGYPGDEDKARELFSKLDQKKATEDFVAATTFLNLETAVGRTRVGRHGVRWQGATTTQATAC